MSRKDREKQERQEQESKKQEGQKMEERKQENQAHGYTDRTEEFAGEEMPQEDDDNRVIVNMNVEGMPGYRPSRKEQDAGQPQEMMTKRETRQFMLTATLTGLAVAAVFSLVLILFALFCTQVWFR